MMRLIVACSIGANLVCLRDYTVWIPCNMFCICGRAKRCWQAKCWFGQDFLRIGATSRESNQSDSLPERVFKQWPFK